MFKKIPLDFLEQRPTVDVCIQYLGDLFPELKQFKDTPQDPIWHAEGNVHIHTDMVLQELYKIFDTEEFVPSPEEYRNLVLAALLHDIAKPLVTREVDGRIKASRHEEVGRNLVVHRLGHLEGLSTSDIILITNLVGYHQRPKLLVIKDEIDADLIKVEEKDLSSVIHLLQVANKALEGSDSTPYDAIKFDEAYYRIKADGSIKSITKAEAEGSIVQLHKTFGGTLNSKGYIELDPTIGLIYGDGITLTRATQIYKQGYASNCVVDGVGSYTYAGGMLTRDSLSMAIKASYGVVDGQPVNIFKEPKTDTSKRSLKGMLAVFKQNPGEYSVQENCTVEEAAEGLLTTVFKDSTVTQTQTFEDIQKLALEI